jgi:hypothetical protein
MKRRKPYLDHDRDRERFTGRTKIALLQILKADRGGILSEEMYEDGEGLERLLRNVADRDGAIAAIKTAIGRAEAAGVSVRSWDFFAREVRMKRAR